MIDFSQLGMNSNQTPINPRDIFMRLSQKNCSISISKGRTRGSLETMV